MPEKLHAKTAHPKPTVDLRPANACLDPAPPGQAAHTASDILGHRSETGMDLRNAPRSHFALWGAVIGGAIALGGYAVLKPEVDTLWSFLAIRMAIGATVAATVGPAIIRGSAAERPDTPNDATP